MDRIPFPFLLPWIIVIFIIVVAGGLGVSFMILHSTALGEWAVIALGLFIVVGVPTTGAILAKRFGRPGE